MRGGGGEQEVGVSVGGGDSRSVGLGVSRGGVGVASEEELGVMAEEAELEGAAAVWGLVPLVASPCSDWLCLTSSWSILQHFSTLPKLAASCGLFSVSYIQKRLHVYKVCCCI